MEIGGSEPRHISVACGNSRNAGDEKACSFTVVCPFYRDHPFIGTRFIGKYPICKLFSAVRTVFVQDERGVKKFRCLFVGAERSS